MKKIVVKVGTNVLTTQNGALDTDVIYQLAQQIAEIQASGTQVVLVSSGAVGAGKTLVKLANTTEDIAQRQIYSAVGQAKLISTYAKYFADHKITCAQVLATKNDFSSSKEHYKNMKSCLQGLLKEGIVPIVNENDVVSLSELMFTDNDELAGLMAFMIEADKLIILSNVAGVYDGNPEEDGSKVITEIPFGNERYTQFIQKDKSSGGRGGMQSKFDTAKRVTEKGIVVHIANGKQKEVILDILKTKKVGTVFLAKPH